MRQTLLLLSFSVLLLCIVGFSERVTVEVVESEQPQSSTGGEGRRLIKNARDFDKIYTKRFGDAVKFRCAIRHKHHRVEAVAWVHKGRPINNETSKRHSVFKKSNGDYVLKISELALTDSGAYECIVTADDCQTGKTLFLTVQSIQIASADGDDPVDCSDFCRDQFDEWNQLELPRQVRHLLSYGPAMIHAGWATQGGSITIYTQRSHSVSNGTNPHRFRTDVNRLWGNGTGCSCLAASLHYAAGETVAPLVVTATAGSGSLYTIGGSGDVEGRRPMEPLGFRHEIVHACGVYESVNSRCVDNDVSDAMGKWRWTVARVPLADVMDFVCSAVAPEESSARGQEW